MTPQQIFASLARSKRLPRNAMAAAGRQREAMVPLFLEYLVISDLSEGGRTA